jgi:hypothetical protein
VDAEVFGKRRCVDYIRKFPIFWPITATETVERLVSIALIAMKQKIPIYSHLLNSISVDL